MTHRFSILLVLLSGLISVAAVASEYEVGQRDKAFTVKSLKIKRGDVVSFPNHDAFFHNVYSTSVTKTFDLGSYQKGQTKKVVFDKPGKVDVSCVIHPAMRMTIEVE